MTNKNKVINLIAAKKITAIYLIMASFILAIANSSNLQFADAHKSANEPNIEFIQQFGTSVSDYAYGVSADSSGGVYVVGSVSGEFPGQTDEGGEDVFIRKYNSDGDEEWTRQFGTSGFDFAFGVSADSSGGVYVFGDSDGTFPGQTNDGGKFDAFLVKFAIDDDDKKKHDDKNKKKHHDDDAKRKHYFFASS